MAPGVDCAVTRNTRCSEVSITVRPQPGDADADLFDRLAIALKELDATILKLTVFGSLHASNAVTEAMQRAIGRIDWPMTWVEGGACGESAVAGVQVAALSGGEVCRIEKGGRVVGSVFSDGDARHCLLEGLRPRRISATRPDQTREMLEQLQETLAEANFSLGDVMRTWFFLEDLLSWYDEFNKVRTDIYSQTDFRTGCFPASTGVAGRNPAGAALAVGAWAVQPGFARVRNVASPLQGSAVTYGSAFSRAMELSSAAGRRLLISGTASIGPEGDTLWKGNVRRQIALTMEVVEALLRSRGLAFGDVTRATAYFKYAGSIAAFSGWCATRRLGSLPVVPVHCDICREDLLFELEADAWTDRPLPEDTAGATGGTNGSAS